MKTYQTDVCIVGAGPAGMFTALLLAKQGVDVLLLERHPSFDREFRGEVLQIRFVQLMKQLGLNDYLQAQGRSVRIDGHDYYFKNEQTIHIEFQDLNPETPYSLWMSQPVMLDALMRKAQEFPSFQMWFNAGVKELIREEDAVAGVIVEYEGEEVEVRARVTIGADGRFSTVRRLLGAELEYEHYENDYLWFTANKPAGWPNYIRLVAHEKQNYIIFPRYPDTIQAGITMPKGQWKQVQERGIEALRAELADASEAFVDFAAGLTDFEPFHILQARLHFVKEWAQNGALLIGDAAHCAAPTGGIGVSLSVATGVVAAQVVYEALQKGDVSAARLGRVQELRGPEMRRIHETQKHQGRMGKAQMKHTPEFETRIKKMFVMEDPLPIAPHFIF
ncbi:MAG TPA: FAD-dependent oxidoreductase [Bacilli bacterium]|nr:FAD-dependent oxidoreductase [Bacilli bacterium]